MTRRTTVRRRMGAEPWQASGLLSGIVLSAPVFSATARSIGIEVPFTGTATLITSAYAEYRPQGTTNRRITLPLMPISPASGAKGIYGSALFCTPGTTYQVRIFVTVGTATAIAYGTATTRPEALTPVANLAVTHYVRADGSDSNTGTADSSGGAWATITKAMTAAPSGAIVQVGPGYFAGQGTTAGQSGRTLPITLLAKFPAVDDDRVPINAGNLTVIEASVRAGPVSNGVVTEAPWVSTDLTGPNDGLTHTVWKWAGASAAAIGHVGYGATRATTPKRLAYWKSDAIRLGTAAGWAELLYTNRTYTYGFYQSGSDLYCRLPGDVDPNTLWWVCGGLTCGLSVDAADCRISGFVIRGWDRDIQVGPSANRTVIDHCRLHLARYPLADWATAPSTYATDVVAERNLCEDSTCRGPAGVSDSSTIPWAFIKTNIKQADGSLYATTKVGDLMEGGVVTFGMRRFIWRHNTSDGTFNGIGTFASASFDRYACGGMDVHDNIFKNVADDFLEPEANVINFRAWANRMEYGNVFVSTGPVNYGPVYIIRNVAWRIGLQGMAVDQDGVITGAAGIGYKYSRASSPQARVYSINNTVWIDDPASDSGGGQFASGSGVCEGHYMRNNIIRVTRNGFEYFGGTTGPWDEQYNQFVTSDASRGMKLLSPQVTYTTFASYQAASSQGANSNLRIDLHDTTTLDAQFMDAVNGDLRLKPTSILRELGVVVVGVVDRPTLDYLGTVPNLGYQP